ncbi:hypothetical protein HYH03_017020 [Edaphochlamys debaryana]|uniref:Ataxin-10 domain-containing protein n=1 Tax=Edaphochlamys debaryana TaxID=47281 RepID=A0A836BR03_9CHLO|nr:hypothetical protein HYH03_017020 [Edaphochlamys debaryana]|eukprot:KAG2484138.1 hypothetical protein HYH03_017020 [Edaphochlamys debaryana]
MLIAACAQLMANLANSGEEGARAVWAAAFPAALRALVEHRQESIHTPATLVLFACCRQDVACSRALCGLAGADLTSSTPASEGATPPSSAAGDSSSPSSSVRVAAGDESAAAAAAGGSRTVAAGIWTAVLHRLMAEEPLSPAAAEREGAPPPVHEWAALLVSCVGLRQGLLGPLLGLLSPPVTSAMGPGPEGSAATQPPGAAAAASQGDRASASAGDADVSTVSYGPYVPVLLHTAAMELVEMTAAAPVDLGLGPEAAAAVQGIQSGTVPESAAAGTESMAAAGPSEPSAAAESGPAGAGMGNVSGTGATTAGASDAASELPPAAWPLAAALRTAGEVAAACARCCAASGAAGQAQAQGRGIPTAPPAAVLEGALEVIKAATRREDGCRPLAAGSDLSEWLLLRAGLAQRVLGMLAALQPAVASRHKPKPGAGPAPGRGQGPSGSAGPVPASDRPVVTLPASLAAAAAGFPTEPPYIGYRGDLVAVLSNASYRRTAVVSELLAGGALELLLAQTGLDDRSPMAREWALWGVRNMAEVSTEVQQRIAGLELQTVVETPELKKLGLKLELDKASGKMKVTKTEEAKAMLEQPLQAGSTTTAT